jgi:hypothetical protein
MPSHRPPQVPLPAHAVRGVVTATQVPRLAELAHDSHCPVQALLQQKPSRQKPLAHSSFTLHPSPFLLATHAPFWHTGVLPPQPPRHGPKLRALGSHVCVPQSLQGRVWFPMQGQPPLAVPSQSASSPRNAQLSNCCRAISPSHGPHACPVQVCVPCWQLPVSVPQARTSPSTQAQPSFGIPLQFASSPPTSQRSRARGPTAPSHAAQAPSAPHACAPNRQLPDTVVGRSGVTALPSGVSQHSRVCSWPTHAPKARVSGSHVRKPQSPHGSL